jgi:hypothetical protein
VAEGQPLSFTVSAIDPDGDALTYEASSLPEGATLIDHTFSWTTSLTQAGTYEVMFTVSDGMLEDSQTITISVIDVQTPRQTHAYGTLKTDRRGHFAMGYHFLPVVNGQVTHLGGYFNGTKLVKLFNWATGELLASATVTTANTWSYTTIVPVDVTAGTIYTVAVYLEGTGGSMRFPLNPPLPQTFGEVQILGFTYVSTRLDPDARPTNRVARAMGGQADIGFIPSP